jgi:uncharacterized protein (TIGR03067 family)
MGMRTCTSGLAVLLVCAFTAALALASGTSRAYGVDKSQAELLKPLQGTWQTDGDGIDAKWTFEGETLKATVNGQDYTCKVKADPDAKPNATLELTINEGPEDAKGKVAKAIYKLDGEKLKICVSTPGKDRPKDFAQIEDEAYLFDMKKQK